MKGQVVAMKKIILVVLLLGIAGIAGVVRSHTKATGTGWKLSLNHDQPASQNVREEIRKTVDLQSGARVEVSGINGWVKIETSNRKTADVYIERLGESQEVLDRRKITVISTATQLTIQGEKGDSGFLTHVFGSKPTEHVTLRLPKEISLVTNGVNGSVTAGDIDGAVEVSGVNGKVDIGQATGSAEINGINGNVFVGLTRLGKNGVDISGVNGNIELRFSQGVNADFESHGMNGQVVSDLPNVTVDKNGHGSYNARIGSGGSEISASGINGNIRLTSMSSPSASD